VRIRAWRLVKATNAADAFSGDGARRFGGRWNSIGVGVVYASESIALAALEILVGGAAIRLLDGYVKICVEFDSSLVQTVTGLPRNWNACPAGVGTREIGDRWAKELRGLVLKVPSTVIPEENNFLINPTHPAFRTALTIGKAERFCFDSRLTG
jgi:RES domain-containing protein